MATENFRRKMAFEICPELKREIARLECEIENYSAAFRLLTEINNELFKRIDSLLSVVNDLSDTIIKNVQDEDASGDVFEQVLGTSVEELEQTLSNPNGKLVFK